MAKPKGTPIVVLGMHRSGTSLVASILRSIGVSMGQNFLDSDSFNPNGYFEDEDFLWINKGIIEHADGTWYDPPPIDKLAEGSKKFEDSIKKTILAKRQKAGLNPWGWKDPRNCLTCWSYLPHIPDAKFILIVRRISDIKLSLNKTHGYLADWDKVIDAYYDSVNLFLQICPNALLGICFEELVYRKYAKKAVRKILHLADKPDRLTEKAMSVIRFR